MKSLDTRRIAGENLSLVADIVGTASEPTIVFLHGSGQTRQSWRRALMEAKARKYRAVALDLRGHGDSDWSAGGEYSLDLFTADVIRALDHIGGRPVLVGASLGGMIGMKIAAKDPSRLRALALVDVTPRFETEGAMEVQAFMESAPQGFGSLEEAADAVAAYLPHRPRPKDTAGLSRNLRQRNGRYYWHWDPALMNMGRNWARGLKVSVDNSLEDAARAITVPTLLIRGGRSRIVSDKTTSEFLQLVKHAEYVDIPEAHHMVAGDANDAFNDAVFPFVDRQFESRPHTP